MFLSLLFALKNPMKDMKAYEPKCTLNEYFNGVVYLMLTFFTIIGFQRVNMACLNMTEM